MKSIRSGGWWARGMALWLGLATGITHAQGICPPPTGPVVLRLHPANGPSQTCDLDGLDRLPQHTLQTRLPAALGLAGQHRWSGVALAELAHALGLASGQVLQLTALNHYTVDIPYSDLARYAPVLASRRNGSPLAVRDKGPLILIYPFDRHPELDVPQYLNRSIWQVHDIRVR